ncbi:tetranectin-like [Asterias amurensis]|uniref:tetranectin-like n=1 Tax=Asterias amurensis TaxID=7602 RepID=UPI003AB2E1EE
MANFVLMGALNAACPPGWFLWQGSCYIFLPGKMDFIDGKKSCSELGANMMVPDTEDEQDFIWREIETQLEEGRNVNSVNDLDVWIGCQDFKNDGSLVCMGVEGDLTFKNWEQSGTNDEPGEPNEKCVRMTGKWKGKWGDSSCSDIKLTACEMPVSGRMQCVTANADGRFGPSILHI